MAAIYRGLNDNGCLLLVEKVLGEHSTFNRLFIDHYYEMKRRKGYSDLEIAQKREALENVLVPYRLEENKRTAPPRRLPPRRRLLQVVQLLRHHCDQVTPRATAARVGHVIFRARDALVPVVLLAAAFGTRPHIAGGDVHRDHLIDAARRARCRSAGR